MSMNEKTKFHCPRCNSTDLLIYDEIVECPECNLTFTKKFLRELQDDSILAEEEKDNFVHALKNEKSE